VRIACIGECMIEMAGASGLPGEVRLGFGGDTLNSAIYLTRLLGNQDHSVHFVTRLGGDPYSYHMENAWRKEGLNNQYVEHVAGRQTGLYAIDVDSAGERHFTYWRSEAPARELFEGEEGAGLIEKLFSFDAILYSGITLAVLFPESRKRLLKLAGRMKAAGRLVAYDTNYREQLWREGDAPKINRIALNNATVALPSLEDLEGIFSKRETVAQWRLFLEEFSIPEVALKCGGESLDLFSDSHWRRLPLEKDRHPVDTTAAGDSFNAGYLAARSRGEGALEASHQAHALGRAVVAHPGAIIPIDAMPQNDLSSINGEKQHG